MHSGGNDLTDLLSTMPPDKRETVLRVVTESAAKAIKTLEDTLPSTIEKILSPRLVDAFQKLGYTEEVAGLVQLLAARSGDSRESVLRKALTLYGLALDANEKGNKLAVLSPDDEIVQDITGIDDVSQFPVAAR